MDLNVKVIHSVYVNLMDGSTYIHAYTLYYYMVFHFIMLFTALVCENDTCSENEVCVDTETGYLCPCDAGYKRDNDGPCCKLPLLTFGAHA